MHVFISLQLSGCHTLSEMSVQRLIRWWFYSTL